MYLLDTDTVIFSLKGNETVRKNLQDHLNDPIKISIVTCMELYYGAYKSQKVASNLAKVKNLEQSLEVIPIGQESADIFGMLKAQLESQGFRLDDFDLSIAVCALAHNLTLVTNNIDHFKRIDGLKLANWTKT
jgi:predicted nucleic acid-binding protein